MNPENQSINEPIKPTPKTNWVVSFAFLFLGIAIGSLGLWAYQNYLMPKGIILGPYTPEETGPSVSTSTPDPTANWKTYVNYTYKFSFKYPSSMIFEERVKDLIVFVNEEDKDIPQAGIMLDTRYATNYDQTIIKVRKDLINIEETDLPSGIKITGNIGPLMGEGTKIDRAILKVNSKVVSLETLSDSPYSHFFNQILSTFKFLDDGIPQITEEELSKGWYWGNSSQKKPGTPKGWVYTEAGKSSCWHSPTSSCGQ